MIYRIGKSWTFDYAHRLPFHEGACQRLHGHTGTLEVVVESDALINDGPCRGMVMDFGTLSEIVQPYLDNVLDHHYLNETCGHDPTAEYIAQGVFNFLETRLETRLRLMRVKVWETPTAWAEVSE